MHEAPDKNPGANTPGVWRIEMLGELRTSTGELVHNRFSTRQTAALLAYLALNPRRNHPREELVELLWPGADPAASKNRLSQALASLRRQLEPPGFTKGSVLMGDYRSVRLNPEAIETDVAEFERHARLASSDDPKSLAKLKEALRLYRGELLPGFYDDWLVPHRQQLSDLHAAALARVTTLAEEDGDLSFASDALVSLVALDPLNEQNQQNLMMLYCRRGQSAQAIQQYESLERVLQTELGEEPSSLSKSLAEKIRRGDFQKLAAKSAPLRRKRTPEEGLDEGPRVQLPPQATRFFGRAQELLLANQLLCQEGCRLVNLIGGAGAGKSRLSIEIARLVSKEYKAVWFVPLADLSNSEQIPEAIRRAMGAAAPESGTVLDDLLRRLKAAGPCLLILDNFERFSERGSGVVRKLLDEVPELSFLVTSRHRLGLYEERDILVDPLPIPQEDSTLEQLSEVASIQLFVNRAQAVKPDFQLTARNMQAVSALCRRLEGVPLAIELAAAWCSTLSPSQLLEGMEHRFELLVSRRRDIAPRHRSLRAAIEYGYELLPPDLQSLFKRLAIFRGGWTLEATKSVSGLDDPRQALHELAERSLLKQKTSETEDEVRFDMLDSLRDHALEQLTGEEEHEAQRRHAEFFLSMSELASSESEGPEQSHWIARLTGDHANILSALQWCYDNDRLEWAIRLVCGLEIYWDARGPLAEGREWLERLLAAVGDRIQPYLRANAHRVLGWVAFSQGDFSGSEQHYSESLAIYRQLGKKSDIALVLNHLAAVGIWVWDGAKAATILSECLVLSEELRDPLNIARTLRGLGLVARQQREYETANTHYHRALAIYEEHENNVGKAAVFGNLSIMASHQGHFDLAEKYARKAMELGEEIGSNRIVASNLENLAAALFGKGSKTTALGLMCDAVQLVRDIGNRPMLFYKLETASYMAHEVGDEEQSAIFASAAQRISKETGVRPDNPYLFDRVSAEHSRKMSEAELQAATAWGESLPDDEAANLFIDWARTKIGAGSETSIS